MFCPRCSQEQVSEEINFCPRCGFLLSDVAEALQNNGRVERNLIQSAKSFKKDASVGIALMFLSAVFILLSFIFGTPEPSYFVQFNLLVGILVFLSGIAFIGYKFWVKPVRLMNAENSSADDDAKFFEARKTGKILAQADFSNVVDFENAKSGLTTNELDKTPSVTEGTTKNLKFENNQ
jgi:hypothetical protein